MNCIHHRPAFGVTCVALATLMVGCAGKPQVAEQQPNRRLVSEFVHEFYDQRDVRGAFERYVALDYIQHNPNIPDGREAAIVALTPLFANRDMHLEVRHVVVDGDMAVVHLLARESPTAREAAVADVFRIQAGKIVEHWDIIQVAPDHSVNPHPLF